MHASKQSFNSRVVEAEPRSASAFSKPSDNFNQTFDQNQAVNQMSVSIDLPEATKRRRGLSGVFKKGTK